MRMTKYIHFLFFTAFLFASCAPAPVPGGSPSYPKDIVTSVGTLKYIRTLWDMATIYDGQKIDNEIWIFAASNGATLFKGMDKSVSIPIDFVQEKYWYYSQPARILPKGDYFNFLVGRSKKIYYLARVHRATMERQYFRIPILDGSYYGPAAYWGNDDVFFRNNDNGKYYMLNEACDNVTEITEQEFQDLYSPGPDYVTDDEGRYYQINRYTDRFEISVDNGKTWHQNIVRDYPLGINIVSRIITQNDSLFLLCMPITEPEFIGGGIHEFKWEKKGGEE